MVFYSVTGGRLFSLELLLLMASLHYYASFANGQQVGVSLKLHGVTIPNNSLVDIEDILYTAPELPEFNVIPTNTNGLHDQTLVCVTDLVDCCDTPRTVHGDWYYSNGDVVQFDATGGRGQIFRANRGPNEVISERQFYGSVRLFRRYTPRRIGLYCCKLPSAADPNVNQTLCAGIVDFGPDFRVPPVTISPSGSNGTAGETYSLTCSTSLHPNSIPFPSGVPLPTFEWLFGPNNSSLPSGVTSPLGTTFNYVDIYPSTLQFSSLSQSHAGMYTCRLGPGRLANHAMVTVNAPTISVQITTSGAPVLGQNGYSLTCVVSGAGNLNASITYQWTKNNGTQTQVQVGMGNDFSFSPLRLSDAGQYTCQATVSSLYLNNGITMMASLDVTILIPSVSVQITDGGDTPTAGENYQLTCSVSGAENLNPTVTYQWIKNSGGQAQVGTLSTLSFTPLRLSDAASYVCTITISSSYLTGDIVTMDSHDVRIQIPTQSSITLTSSKGNSGTQIVGSDATLTCTVQLNSAIVGSEIFLLVVDAQLSRDGIPLALTGPIVTETTITYTTQLNSFRRNDSGNYTCTATVRPQPSSTYLTGSEILSDTVIIKSASVPPVNVRATQSSSSAPVEVSWSPPSDGATNITGYRIFYGSGKIVLVPSVADITLVGLKVDGNYIGQSVSIRSESDQLYSELINVSVTLNNNEQCAGVIDTAMRSSCSSEVGIAVGVIIVVECLVVMVITVIVVLCWWRKKSSRKDDFAVSANVAYGEVSLKPGEMEGEYENPDKILGKSGQSTDTTTTAT